MDGCRLPVAGGRAPGRRRRTPHAAPSVSSQLTTMATPLTNAAEFEALLAQTLVPDSAVIKQVRSWLPPLPLRA